MHICIGLASRRLGLAISIGSLLAEDIQRQQKVIYCSMKIHEYCDQHIFFSRFSPAKDGVEFLTGFFPAMDGVRLLRLPSE